MASQKEISRREFLSRLGIGAAGASLAPWLFSVGCAKPPEVGQPLSVLSPQEYQTLEVFAERFFPKEGAIGIAASEVNVAGTVDRMMKRLPALKRWMLKIALWILERSPILRYGKRFTRLSPAQQLEHMEGWGSSTANLKRSAFLMFKGAICLAYYGHPQVLQKLGHYEVC